MIQSLLDLFASFGLTGVFVLMALESSLVPIPSELVMLPAGILAAQGVYSPWLVVLAGGLGSLAGAWANRILAAYIGKPFLLKYGKYILMPAHKYEYAESLFLKNANLYTFIGRLLPVVRHLISLPAGIFNMPPLAFSVITFAGATLWCSVLTGLGFFFGNPVIQILEKYLWELKIGVLIILVGFVIWFFTHQTPPTKKQNKRDPQK
jgi:membrane protein DedA with SNARE-associated domain